MDRAVRWKALTMSTTRYFAILGAMRTGSNLLEKTLEALGDTVCYGEAFNPRFVSGPRKEQVLGFDLAQRKADPFGFLEAMITSWPRKTAGFRIFQGHETAILEHVLGDPNCIRIVLTRTPLESYISLKIARETDQWMLRDPRRRTMARVRFDAAEFAEYRRKQAAYYAWLDARMASHGTQAIRIDYAQLSEHAILQQIARDIGSAGTVPAESPTLRQNPEALSLKVENYAEMCAELGIEPEEATETPAAGPIKLMCPPDLPIAFAPVAGPALTPVITMLHRIEVRDLSRPKLTPPVLLDRALRGVLYPSTGQGSRTTFTMICDPFVRLHAAFVEEVLGPGFRFSSIRRTLIEDHGGIPPPKGLTTGRAEYPQDLHQLHFAGFVKIVAEAIDGSGTFPLIADWMPQAEIIDLHAGTAEVTKVFRHDAFEEAVHWLTDLMGLPRFPPGQLNGMRVADQQSLVPIEDVRIPELCKLVENLYAVDYRRFGPFPPDV